MISYFYKMESGREMIPQPGNNEVEAFSLVTLDNVKAALMEGEFVANRAMVWLAHLIRHSIPSGAEE
jgi:hypothetical protein